MRLRPPETGIECFVGRPGAGKSVLLVRRILDVLIKTRRPVFTNLPLRWRVVRKYLRDRGGSLLEGLLFELTEAHFESFLERFAARARFFEGLKGGQVGKNEWGGLWLAGNGPDVMVGAGANWIPAGSLVVIDEVQHWTPNKAIGASRKVESVDLLTYLTMHRHMHHWIWVATQSCRQVSQTWKSLASVFWDIRNMGHEAIAWGLRWKWIGVTACGYRSYAALDWDGDGPRASALPIECFIFLPTAPWNLWSFRLYDSFTHCGSASELRGSMEDVRTSVGLERTGAVMADAVVVKAKGSWWGRWYGLRLVRGLSYGALAIVIIGMWLPTPGVPAVEVGVVAAVVDEVRLVGCGGQSCYWSDGSVSSVGDLVHGHRVLSIGSGVVATARDGVVSAWVCGEPPVIVCAESEICEVAGRLRGITGEASGGS